MCVLASNSSIKKRTLVLKLCTFTHIYRHTQTDSFVASRFYNVTRHVRRFKLGSKPA